MSYRPTPRDVLELAWCPRYLWYTRHVPVPPTERMKAGKHVEEAAKRRLAARLRAEVNTLYIDIGWARGAIDAVLRKHAAAPIEVKMGPKRDIYRWQLYAEAYIMARGLGTAVHRAYLYYADTDTLEEKPITTSEMKIAEKMLIKARTVVEGPPPPAQRTPKCRYCEYRNICEIPQK